MKEPREYCCCFLENLGQQAVRMYWLMICHPQCLLSPLYSLSFLLVVVLLLLMLLNIFDIFYLNPGDNQETQEFQVVCYSLCRGLNSPKDLYYRVSKNVLWWGYIGKEAHIQMKNGYVFFYNKQHSSINLPNGNFLDTLYGNLDTLGLE